MSAALQVVKEGWFWSATPRLPQVSLWTCRRGSQALLTFRMIECFVKMAKTHRNIANQDNAFVEKTWREAVLTLDENWRRYYVMTMGTILMTFDEYHQYGILLLFFYQIERHVWLFNQKFNYIKIFYFNWNFTRYVQRTYETY